MLRALTGHTSIYLCKQLKTHIKELNQLMAAKGFTSFNQYANSTFVHDLTHNYEKYVGNKSPLKHEVRIDYYNDTPTMAREKLNTFTNGQILDSYNHISDWRLLLSREAKKRGIKI